MTTGQSKEDLQTKESPPTSKTNQQNDAESEQMASEQEGIGTESRISTEQDRDGSEQKSLASEPERDTSEYSKAESEPQEGEPQEGEPQEGEPQEGGSERERAASVHSRGGSEPHEGGSERERAASVHSRGGSERERAASVHSKVAFVQQEDGSEREQAASVHSTAGPERERSASIRSKAGFDAQEADSEQTASNYSQGPSDYTPAPLKIYIENYGNYGARPCQMRSYGDGYNYHNRRIKELSQPKIPLIGWHTCVGPNVMWGTQEMMWPVSARAMNGSATERLKVLATPKKDFQTGTVHQGRPQYFYSAGRPSVIWHVADGAKKAEATERVGYLSQPKLGHPEFAADRPQYFYSCGRETPIWPVTSGAQGCPERPRTTALACHRDYHPMYQGERPIQSVVTEAAMKNRPSEYISSLANPKPRSSGPFRAPQWPVTEEAKTAVATARLMELARAKPLAEGFQHAKEVEWPVTKAAKRAVASGRVAELATPISRETMDYVQFNPNAFQVKESALKGHIPQRIADLYTVINR